MTKSQPLTRHIVSINDLTNKEIETIFEVAQGLLKPFVFAIVISMVGCFYGLRATGGTQGVGRSTTQAMVASAVLILVLDVLVTKIFVAAGAS